MSGVFVKTKIAVCQRDNFSAHSFLRGREIDSILAYDSIFFRPHLDEVVFNSIKPLRGEAAFEHASALYIFCSEMFEFVDCGPGNQFQCA